jgi:PAS domain S-box-containing protein
MEKKPKIQSIAESKGEIKASQPAVVAAPLEVESTPGAEDLRRGSTGPYLAFDKGWRISASNAPAREMLGLTAEDLKEAHLLDVLRDRLEMTAAVAFQTTLDHQVAQRFDVFVRTRGKWFEVIVYPTLEGAASYWKDITARREAENAVRENQEHLRAIFDSMTEAFIMAEVIFDRDGKPVDYRFLEVNRAIEKNTGLAPESFIGKTARETSGLMNEDALRRYARVAITGEPAQFEYYSPSLKRHFEARVFSPALGRFAAVLIDITHRKHIEEKMRQQADLLELSFDAIIVWRLGGGIESWNKGAENLYGYSKEEAQGREAHDLLGTEPSVPMEQVEAELEARGDWDGELRQKTKDGRDIVVSTRLQMMLSGDGVKRVLEINRDITAHKQAELAERELNRELAWTVKELKETLTKAKTLRGLIPICASCKKVRNDEGYWQQVEVYVRDHSEADFSHGICPDCASKLYPDYTKEP